MRVSASSWTALNGVVPILRSVDFTSCSSTNPPATIIVFTCSCPTSCSERKRAKFSLFSAEARKLFQSDGNGRLHHRFQSLS